MLLNWLDDKNREPGACIVKVNGNEISDFYPNLVELSAVLDRQDSAQATLIFETRRMDDGSWNVHDDERIRPWSSISIAATFGDSEQAVFDGFIRQVKVDFPEQKGAALVTVICQDTSLLLDRTQRNVRWGDTTPTTDGAIATQITSEAGITLLDSPGEGFTNLIANQNTTDIKFLKKRAQENAYDIFFREGKMYFGPLRMDHSPQPTIVLYAGPDSNGIRFNLEDDGHRPETIIYEVANDADDITQEQSVNSDLPVFGTQPASSSAAGLGDFAWRLRREGSDSEEHANQRAQAAANEEALRIKATGDLDGVLYGHVLLPGAPVFVDGVGERYGGRWYVIKVEHKFDINGYKQSFEVARNGYGDDFAAPTSPIAGLL
tara:strand:- start:977 stop:2107 length:1131 start_codon:yes stop_codon:yes gene_type:complete